MYTEYIPAVQPLSMGKTAQISATLFISFGDN